MLRFLGFCKVFRQPESIYDFERWLAGFGLQSRFCLDDAMWLAFTLLAALMQAGRNALQKQLSVYVPVLGVALARFLFASPLALAYLLGHYQFSPELVLPHFSWIFVLYVVLAAVAQIGATVLMVQLFHLKNYAVGVGLAKSEAIWAAILGVLFFGAHLGFLGWIGVLVGTLAIFLMSGAQKIRQFSWQTLSIGAASGLCFALTSLWVRQASLQLDLPHLAAAAWVLVCVISLQAMALSAYLFVQQRETLKLLWQHKKLAIANSVFSFFGSLGWFSAMSLQHVALVKTVGQIEVLFMLMISAWIFKEPLRRQDWVGLALIVVAAVLVVW